MKGHRGKPTTIGNVKKSKESVLKVSLMKNMKLTQFDSVTDWWLLWKIGMKKQVDDKSVKKVI